MTQKACSVVLGKIGAHCAYCISTFASLTFLIIVAESALCRCSRAIKACVGRIADPAIQLVRLVRDILLPVFIAHKEPSEASRARFHDVPWVEGVDEGFDA